MSEGVFRKRVAEIPSNVIKGDITMRNIAFLIAIQRKLNALDVSIGARYDKDGRENKGAGDLVPHQKYQLRIHLELLGIDLAILRLDYRLLVNGSPFAEEAFAARTPDINCDSECNFCFQTSLSVGLATSIQNEV